MLLTTKKTNFNTSTNNCCCYHKKKSVLVEPCSPHSISICQTHAFLCETFIKMFDTYP